MKFMSYVFYLTDIKKQVQSSGKLLIIIQKQTHVYIFYTSSDDTRYKVALLGVLVGIITIVAVILTVVVIVLVMYVHMFSVNCTV